MKRGAPYPIVPPASALKRPTIADHPLPPVLPLSRPAAPDLRDPSESAPPPVAQRGLANAEVERLLKRREELRRALRPQQQAAAAVETEAEPEETEAERERRILSDPSAWNVMGARSN